MPILTRRALFSQLAFAATAAAAKEATHTLVCVFLRGGADTLNMWVPYSNDTYYRQRPTLAIKRPGSGSDASIKLTDHYALHPAMQPLEGVFKEGRLGAVQAVGLDNNTGSHFECQDQMEHGDSATGQVAGGGWLGRYLRARGGKKQSPLSAIAIGTALPESLRGAPSVSVLEHINDIAIKAPSGDPDAIVAALRTLYGADITMLGERGTETLDLFKRVSALQGKGYTPEHGAEYAKEDNFASGLSEIARLIKARVGLEVACVDLGGWDTHFFQGTASGSQAEKIKTLAEGIAAFDTDLKSHRASYTVMITTEFGRRIYENASLGTDHGRGFTFMALGDRVKGGRILGPWPTEATDESNPLGPGGIKPETDFRDVFAEVLRGSLGLSDAEAKVVFPDAGMKNVGLMG